MLSRDDLKALALFESLGDEQLDQLLDRHRESTHQADQVIVMEQDWGCLLYTSPSPRDRQKSRMPSSA